MSQFYNRCRINFPNNNCGPEYKVVWETTISKIYKNRGKALLTKISSYMLEVLSTCCDAMVPTKNPLVKSIWEERIQKLCLKKAAADFITSIFNWNLSPYSACFSAGKSVKSQPVRSGLYGGCDIIGLFFWHEVHCTGA